MNEFDTFNRILLSMHEAMLDDACWPATSALIDEACGSMGNALLIGEGTGDDVRVVFAAGYYRGQRREDLERDYLENYHPWDERVPRFRKLPDSHLTHVTELYTQAELRTSRTYNEFSLRSHGRNSLNARLDGPGDSHFTWVICDPVKPGSWATGQINTIKRLLPHVRQFVQVRQALAAAEALGATLTGLLDNTRIGAIYLDRRGGIMEVNAPAHGLLRQGDGLFDRDSFLRARLAADDDRLQRLLGRALPDSAGAPASSGSMAVRRAPGRQRLVVHISPVSIAQTDLGAHRPAALVLTVDPASRPRLNPKRVGLALGLTAAESRVAALLAEGLSVPDIAAASGYREGYVRWLLKQAYRKHGVSGQAALVRLVLAADVLPRR